MFTGIIEEQGTVVSMSDASGGKRLVVDARVTVENTRVDDSISVSGVCLTVVAIDGWRMTFDLVPETLRRSTLGSASQGSKVNLERAVSGAERFGGHYVQGHVDTTAAITERTPEGNAVNFTFERPKRTAGLITEKGFVCIDGVSLTVTHCGSDSFGVSLVPHTHERVTLGACQVGTRVNLEFDVFAKYVQQAVDQRLGKLEQELDELRKHLT